MKELNFFDSNIKFNYEYIKGRVSLLDLGVDTVEENELPVYS